MLKSIKELFENKYFLMYLIIGILPLFLINTEHDVPILYAFKYLSLPVIIISYCYTYTLKEWRDSVSRVAMIIMPLSAALLITFFSIGYISVVNMISHTKVEYSGKIVLKQKIRGRYSTTYHITIFDNSLHEKKEFDISSDEYSHLKEGDVYRSQWNVGLLGIPYKLFWE